MANIQVLDVQSTVPVLRRPPDGGRPHHPGHARRCSWPSARPRRRNIEFLSQNETISVVQTQHDTNPPPVQQCIGTDQTTGAP